MKNFRKIALGLIIGAMAIGFSAFTNAPAKAKFATRYWINNGSGQYVELTTTPDPITNCRQTSQYDCLVESTNTSIPALFPLANPSHYPVTADPDSKKAIYSE